MSTGYRLYTKNQMIKYVRRTSQRLFMMNKLNEHYADVINAETNIRKLASYISNYTVNCRFLSSYKQLCSDKDALSCKLKEFDALRGAVHAICDYNEKANAYSRAVIRIFDKYSNERRYRETIMPYSKYCKIESRLFSDLFRLYPIPFFTKLILRYSSVSQPCVYETEIIISETDLIEIFGADKPKFNGLPAEVFLQAQYETDTNGCYAIYNKTSDKYYIGYSKSVYASLKSIFSGRKLNSIFSEFFDGDDFYIHIFRSDESSRRDIDSTLRYLAWCYGCPTGSHVEVIGITV